MNYNKLTPEEERIILHKGTEMPFSGKFNKHYEEGTYVCKQCNAPLYYSTSKFNSNCGWPSFDDEIAGAIGRRPDKDGVRTEIVCNNCEGHLGHIFTGERLTDKNVRHCVNSLSLDFIPAEVATKTAIFAGGCFWGVEYYFKNIKGVLSTEVGYIGGKTENPTYKEVCYDNTGHAEALKVVYNPNLTNFEELCKLFFEIHNPTELNRQGPDIGEQYRSEIFYFDDEQKSISINLINILRNKGLDVVTKLTPATTFYKAEEYHQDYYGKNNKRPYCHFYKKLFD